MVCEETGKLTQDGVISALGGCSQLKSLSLFLFDNALTRAFLSNLLSLSCRLHTIILGHAAVGLHSADGLKEEDLAQFRQAAKKMQVLPVPVISFENDCLAISFV